MKTTFKALIWGLTLITTSTCKSQIADSSFADTLTIIVPGDCFDGQAVFLSNQIAKKYHFQYDYMGDLKPSHSLELIGKHNDQTDSLLDIINGKDWRQKFETEYQQAYTRDSILISFIKHRLGEYFNKTEIKSLMVYRDSILADDIFRITILGYHDNRNVSFMRFLIKYPALTIVNIDKRIIYRGRRNN